MYRIIRIPICRFCGADLIEDKHLEENGYDVWCCPECGEDDFDPFGDYEMDEDFK